MTFSPIPPDALAVFLGTGDGSVAKGESDWSSLLPGHDLEISGVENLNVAFGTPLTAFGFDFHEPTNKEAETNGCYVPTTACEDSTFEIQLFNGLSQVGSVQFNADDDVAFFVGVHSPMVFDNVKIIEIVGSNDNEYFGEFYTAPVPVPAALPLFGSGLGLMGLFGWWRRRRIAAAAR